MRNDFEEVYRKNIEPSVTELNKKRKITRTLKLTTIISVALFVVLLGLAFYFDWDAVGNFLSIIAIPIVIIAIVFVFYNRYYQYKFKKGILLKLVESIDPSLEFKRKTGEVDSLVNYSKLFLSGPMKFVGVESSISGKMEGRPFSISQARVFFREKKGEGENEKTYERTIFQGLVVGINAPYVNNLDVQYIPRNVYGIQDYYDEFRREDVSYNAKNKEVESVYFTKAESYKSDDLEKVENIIEKLNNEGWFPLVSFCFGKIIFMFPSKDDFFTIPLNEEISEESVEALWNEIYYFLDLVEEVSNTIQK